MSQTAACPACPPIPVERIAAQAASEEPALYLSLPGIHCAGCIGTVERALNAMPGVRDARVNLSLKRVAVHAGPQVQTDAIVETLRGAGYAAYPLDGGVLAQDVDRTARDLLMRLAVAGFAMMNVMLLSVAVWSGAADATRDLFHLISAAIAVPVVGFAGQPFFRSAVTALKARSLNMDVPISLAILLATGMSLYETLNSGRHAYFDAALSLTFFLLIGRYLDQRTRGAARSAARELAALEVNTAHRLQDGQVTRVPVAELAVGDQVMVPTGVRVPVDGTLTCAATTDRSFLTGESAAVSLPVGALVQAGEVNLGAPFTVQATAVGDDTTLRRISALVETAEVSRNRYTALADRAAQVYAPAVHLLALAAFLGWAWFGPDLRQAANVAIAVLIITCPCALGLAVPAVATAAIGRLYRQGFLVKNATALERLAEVDTVVFDKTGTLTVPGSTPELTTLTAEQRSVARALAQRSDHPVSRAIAAGLADQPPADVTDIAEIAGCGVEGRLDGVSVRLGRGAWLGAGFDGPGLRIGATPAIPLPMQETLRPGAAEAVSTLQAAGYAVQIVSGDRPDAVDRVAATLGLENVLSAQSAEAKHDLLRKMAAQGHRVCMVGDGLNDAAALAAAHASIAPSSALDASRNAADIVVLRDSFAALPDVLRVARKATLLSRQNFAIATAYNAVAVPIALMGHATPLIAALAMSLSSITVLLNALRVSTPR